MTPVCLLRRGSALSPSWAALWTSARTCRPVGTSAQGWKSSGWPTSMQTRGMSSMRSFFTISTSRQSSCCKDMPTKKKNAIPDRWTEYTPLGKRIPGTRFIAFKVPLKQFFRYHLNQSEVFGPFDLVRMLEKEGQELGLIIDLTFTTRYYKVEDLPDTLYHLKIFTAGHEVPKDATILSFKKAVRHFLRDNENNDKLIGVHCTHGLNRTGYLICRYLIDVDGMNPQNAINLFNESRGHSIERQKYLDDLMTGPKRSNEGMEEPDQEPAQGLANKPRDDAPSPHHQ